MDRSGQVVLVTGSSSVADGEAVAAELGRAVYVQGDVAVLEDVRRLVATTLDEFGRLDVLVDNAGTSRMPASSSWTAAVPPARSLSSTGG